MTASGAILSPDGAHRLLLWRGSGFPRACWMMLNPSTADADTDDPTIRRCRAFSRRLSCDSFDVLNLWTLRLTDARQLPDALAAGIAGLAPSALAVASDVLDAAQIVICGWGATVDRLPPSPMLELLRPRRLHCLGTTQAGHPRHPLRLAADTPLEELTL